MGADFDIDAIKKQGVSALPIKAHIIFFDVDKLEESIQVASDLLISKDGVPGSILDKDEPQFVQMYTTSSDIGMKSHFICSILNRISVTQIRSRNLQILILSHFREVVC